jgi:hypothetical protein
LNKVFLKCAQTFATRPAVSRAAFVALITRTALEIPIATLTNACRITRAIATYLLASSTLPIVVAIRTNFFAAILERWWNPKNQKESRHDAQEEQS